MIRVVIPKPKESAIQSRAVNYARTHGAIAIKLSMRGAHGVTGYPDYLFCFPGGRVCFIEFKRTGEKPTAIQEQRIENLSKLGLAVFVCDTAETAIAIIKTYLDA